MSVKQLKPDVRRTESSVEEQSVLYDLIASVLEVPRGALNLDTSFAKDLAADSLDMVELAMALEQRFEVKIPDEASSRLKTVRDLLRYVQSTGGSPVNHHVKGREVPGRGR